MTTNAYLDTGVSSDINELTMFYPVRFRCGARAMPVLSQRTFGARPCADCADMHGSRADDTPGEV